MIRIASILILLLLVGTVFAQDSVWTLERCIDYGVENNLTVKQNELDVRVADMTFKTSKTSHIPTLSLSSSYNGNFGRSINPTTNQFESTQFSSAGLSASSSVLLFGWFQKRYTIQNNELRFRQSEEMFAQLKDDISLNISTAYLRCLLAKEQIENTLFQIEISMNNLERIQKILNAGRSNVLELSQSKNQLANDSSIFFQTLLNYEQSLIELKAILNLGPNEKLFPAYNDTGSVLFLNGIDPQAIFDLAINRSHNVKNAEYGLRIARKSISIANAGKLPQFNAYWSSGTNYSSSYFETLPNGERQLMNFGKQLNTNLSQSVGVSMSIPIFNNFASRDAIRTAKIDQEKAEIAKETASQELRQNIYSAYSDYEITLQKYYSSLSALDYATTSFHAATTRYENGLISYFEYLSEKNNSLKAKNEASALKYDLSFKKLLLEYYMNGQL